MPLIATCPSCGGKLRVSDELRGQLVRCPACGDTFTSTPPDEPRDRPLRLSLDDTDDLDQPRSEPAGGTPGLLGAVELNRSSAEEAAPPRRTAPPRLADEHDDLQTCPECGKHVHRDARRCPDCGERLGGRAPEDDGPSIRFRGPRRDAVPDRGPVVLSLGIISLACLTISCWPIGLVLGLCSWIMGQADLRKMKRGDMDTNGRGMTQGGWICGILGTFLNGALTLGCMGLIGFIAYTENHRPVPTFRSSTPVRPPVQQWPPPQPKPKAPGQRF